MFASPSTTILLITRDELLRADMPRRPGGAARIGRETRPAVDDLPSLAEAALNLLPARPGRVWILTTELWTQTLGLAKEAVAGLGVEALATALGFEAEPFSGISGIEARTACVPLHAALEQREFWITLLPEAQLQQIEYAIQQAGGRLAGIAHPGGLPQPMAIGPGMTDCPWQRVELWPGLLLCVTGGGEQTAGVEIVNNNPQPGRWQADAQRWTTLQDGVAQDGVAQDGVAQRETLLATPAVPAAELPALGRIDLSDAAGLEAFLQAWHSELTAAAPRVPLVRPARRPLSVNARRGITAIVTLLVMALCAGHYLFTEWVRTAHVAETARLRGPIEQSQQLKKDSDTLRAKRDKQQAEYDKLAADLAHCRRVLQAHRLRVARLLAVLARLNADEIVLQKIDGTGERVVLHGLALRPEAVNSLARALNAALEPLGWQVQLPSKQSQEMLVGGGPWTFDMPIQDVAPAAPAEMTAAWNLRTEAAP